jgi:hypothetical protein
LWIDGFKSIPSQGFINSKNLEEYSREHQYQEKGVNIYAFVVFLLCRYVNIAPAYNVFYTQSGISLAGVISRNIASNLNSVRPCEFYIALHGHGCWNPGC